MEKDVAVVNHVKRMAEKTRATRIIYGKSIVKLYRGDHLVATVERNSMVRRFAGKHIPGNLISIKLKKGWSNNGQKRQRKH